MGSFRNLFVFLAVVGLIALATESEAAKKKEPEKLVPVKIIKPSETKFKQAKIIQKKEAKPKRFLWFKKKEPKVTQPQMARIVQEPMATQIEQTTAEKAKLIETPKKTVKVKEAEAAAKSELPDATVPKGENASAQVAED
ncbi:hypothetical protein [Pelagicoccus sp. SDUM812002]|uniref:hypothetical protein n=1 Tax=Pelagicoccus sp. SDUM812002 TaxID=3041266 RepID=UPI0028109666|nr:hypothetical protein [Pelagicoccus sp. SDUM812002]MDQ8187068.1 hypothetical protein [Pelagicoccus sp. SDUM812002]